MTDNEGLLEHLRELEEALKDWKRYRSFSLEDIKKDRDKRNMALHAMLVSIQSSIDIANHMIADKGLKKPLTYREAFEILYDAEILNKELAGRLANLAGFRNFLVHIYWQLDLERVYSILQEDFEVLDEFKKWAKKLLTKKQAH